MTIFNLLHDLWSPATSPFCIHCLSFCCIPSPLWAILLIHLSISQCHQTPHIAAGFPPTDTLQHPVLCYVLRRFLNTHPQYSRPRRLPITPYILLLLYCFWSSSPADYENSMLWAACCLAFFAFLRSGEFTCSPQTQHKCLALADIAVDSHSDPQLLWVCIQYSKTDQAGKGTTIALGRTRRILCPVASVLSFLSK